MRRGDSWRCRPRRGARRCRHAGVAQHPHHHDKLHGECLKACEACATVCNETFHHCFRPGQGRPRRAPRDRRPDDRLPGILRPGSELMARESPLISIACLACADACKLCAAECSKHDDTQMKECVAACNACEAACRAMAKAIATVRAKAEARANKPVGACPADSSSPFSRRPVAMRQLAWLTARGEILTQDLLPVLAPRIPMVKDAPGLARFGGSRRGPLRDVPAPPRVRGLLRNPRRDDSGSGLALAEHPRPERLAELRSVPLPRRGIGRGPARPPQPDALGRLGSLGPGGFQTWVGTALRHPSRRAGGRAGLAHDQRRRSSSSPAVAGNIPAARRESSAGSRSACGRRRGRWPSRRRCWSGPGPSPSRRYPRR